MASIIRGGAASSRGQARLWALGMTLVAGVVGCGTDDAGLFGGSSATTTQATGTSTTGTTATTTTTSTGSGGAGHGGAAGHGGTAHGGSGLGGGAGHGGSGGTGGCAVAADCADAFDCTVDACNAGVCEHVPGPTVGPTACPAGQFCDALKGCVQGIACADTAQCVAQLGGDACKTDILCDPKTSICTYQTLDKDHDGHPPPICLGDDCDDSDPKSYPGAPEICDGHDNDCDQQTDDGATCSGLLVCAAGACVCPPANLCGNECVDLAIDAKHCGTCAHACPPTAACSGGACVCPAGATECGGACLDTKVDTSNCGACGVHCGVGFGCVAGSCFCPKTICNAACVDLAIDEQNCGGCGKICPGGTTCQNGTCQCAPGLTLCGGQCVDTKTDVAHCGGCFAKCNGTCQAGVCNLCPTVDLYLLQDRSGSMTSGFGPVDRLQGCQQAIAGFLAEPASATIGLGIGFHALDAVSSPFCVGNADCGANGFCDASKCASAGSSCNVPDYASPAVGIGLVPAVAASIQSALAPLVANGLSMPPAALEGALSYAKGFAAGHPGHKVGMVLLVDSLPNVCSLHYDTTDLLPIAAQYASGSPSVPTYVVALGGDAPKAAWDTLAAAGGTGAARVAYSTAEVQAALGQIRDAAKVCP